MMFDSQASLAAQASLDALWLKTQVISNNLANSDTPGFKASNVSFEQVLEGAAAQTRQQNTEGREVGETGTGGVRGYRARITTDPTTSVRNDGNNVSLEREQTELWKTYAQYSYLLDRVSGHFSSINTAITNMR